MNRLGIQDARLLDSAERVTAAQRLEEPLPDIPISYAGYKALHRHLFEEIYAWAGEPRSVNMSKGETIFAAAGRIDPSMDRQFTLLKQEQHLTGLPPDRFAHRAAIHLSEINAIHPFREGNGRTQHAFLKLLARQAGHTVDLKLIEPTAWIDASISGFAADYRPMIAVIDAALVPDGEGRGVERTNAPKLSDAFRKRMREAARELGAAGTPPRKRGPCHDID